MNWLQSDQCLGEFQAAWYQGKRIIPLLVIDAPPTDPQLAERFSRVIAEDQGFDLRKSITGGRLDFTLVPTIADALKAGLRAGGALTRVGLDPEAFEIDRALLPVPFPGLEAFGDGDGDAAVFYGRSTEIARALEELREMRAGGDRRPFCLLGSSGSGKSSLLKAGVLPRLRREPAQTRLKLTLSATACEQP